MHRNASQRGAALILLLGITATLAILSATLVFVIQNQQSATANDRAGKQSFYASEAALDTAVQFAKIDKTMSTTAEWLTPEDLAAAFAGTFPAGATVTYRVYDNLPTVNYNIKWDQNLDKMVWVEATVIYKGKTTRTRVLVRQSREPFAAALPKAVTYSDTGIMLNDRSNIYALNVDGSPDTSGPPYQTSITAGGTWIQTMPGSWAEVGRFTTNSSTTLAAPGTSTQSLGITTNGSVSMAGSIFNSAPSGSISAGGRTFDEVVIQPKIVGFLSDYFDQAAQASLADESQAGGKNVAVAPTAPGSWTSSGYTTINNTLRNTLQSTTSTAQYDATTNLLRSGSLTLSRGTSTTGRVFNFQGLYVTGDLTLTGPVTVNCTSLYVGGTLTINNTTTTTVTDDFGMLYNNGTGAFNVSGRVNIRTTSAFTGGALTIGNTTTTPVTDEFGVLYAVGAVNVSGNVETSASWLYGGANVTLSGSSSAKTHTYGLVYTNATTGTLMLSGNVQLLTRELVANGNFTISGATSDVKNWLGKVYVRADAVNGTGTVRWSDRASVTSRDYTNPTADPQPLWLGRYWSRTGTYDDEYGPIWVPGNSTTSVVFGSTGASQIWCPLLCTTEKTAASGNITFGSREKPMVFFYMCDNNGIYPQVVDWSCTGTYYGLMVINESTIDISNGVLGTPSIQGAVFAGCPYDPTYTSGLSMSDIVLNDYSSIAYDQSVVGAIATSSLKTTTLVTQIVPGSWQQLPVN